MPELEKLASDITNTTLPEPTENDEVYIDNIFITALKTGSKPLLQALYQKGIQKDFMLRNIDSLLSREIPTENKATLTNLKAFVANLS